MMVFNRKSAWSIILTSTLCCLMMSGCDVVSKESSGAGSTPGPTKKAIKVGLVFAVGGLGDKSFNDGANAGLQRAAKELGVETKAVDTKGPKDFEANLSGLAEAGCNVIFAIGFPQKNALSVVAPKYPDVKFAIVDDVVKQPNVSSLIFSEEQGSFLAGYLAALVSKTGKVGFVGAMTTPLVKRFETGFQAGALTANPKIDISGVKYTESWTDIGLGKAAGSALFNDGCDVVYAAAGRGGLGVISAAKDAGKFAIGVDSNQDGLAPGNVLTSMLKRVDEAVFQTVKDVTKGKFKPGTHTFDLKSNGVGLTDFEFTKNKIGQANIAKLADIKKQIIEGKIIVPAKPEDLASYVGKLKK